MAFDETSVICMQCKGKFWNPKSQSDTQAAVRAKFGMAANKCINDSIGTVKCPFANKSH